MCARAHVRVRASVVCAVLSPASLCVEGAETFFANTASKDKAIKRYPGLRPSTPQAQAKTAAAYRAVRPILRNERHRGRGRGQCS